MRIIILGPSLLQQGGIANYEKIFLKYAPDDVQITHIVTHQDGSKGLKIKIFLTAILQILAICLTKKVDIVQIEVSQRGSAFRQAIMTLIAWAFRKPIIIHAHGSQFHLFYANLPKLIQRSLSWIFGRCQRFIVLSASWQEFYIKTFGLKPEQVVVLYNPVAVPSVIPQRAGNQTINLLFLGRIGERKGAFDLIKAFALLPEQIQHQTRLIMAGDGDLEQATQLVKAGNLADYIQLPGWINSQERDQLISQADIFILPSYNEGLPLAMLEAMAWELPVIVTPVGGIPEIVIHQQNGIIVNPGEITELADNIKNLILSEKLRLSLGEQARKSVMCLDIKQHWDDCLKLYHLVLNQQI